MIQKPIFWNKKTQNWLLKMMYKKICSKNMANLEVFFIRQFYQE